MRNYYEIRSRDVKTEITIGRFTQEILYNDISEMDIWTEFTLHIPYLSFCYEYTPVCDVRIYIRNIIYLSF